MFNNNSPTVHNILYGQQQNYGGMQQCIPPNYVNTNGMMSVGTAGYEIPTMQQQIFDSKYGQQVQQNYQSPMMMQQNLIYQQQMAMQQNMYMQQPTIGGYYNNNMYRGFYNPYAYQQQMELQRIQMQEQMRAESDLMKRFSRNVNYFLGNEVDDKYLSQYDPPSLNGPDFKKMSKEELEDYKYDQMNNRLICMNMVQCNPVMNNYYAANQMVTNKHNEIIPQEMTMEEFFLGGINKIYEQAYLKEYLIDDRDVSKSYNKGLFGQLLEKHSKGMGLYGTQSYPSGSMSSVFRSDIGDLEVKVPDRLMDEYAMKKQAFFNSLMKRD